MMNIDDGIESIDSLVMHIEKAFPELTPNGKKIAGYMLANLAHIPYETAGSIAQNTGTSGITVGRLLRALGFQNLDEFKKQLKNCQVSTTTPWLVTNRMDAFNQRKEHSRHERLQKALTLELEAIQYVYQLALTPAFERIGLHLVQADAIFIIGIQSTRGIAHAFFSHLEYLRPSVFYADGQSGTYVESLNSNFKSPYVLLTDLRAYSKVAQKYCHAAAQRKMDMALVTDVYCPWAHDYPVDLLQIKTDTEQFWDSLSPLSCLFNLLLSYVIDHGGPHIEKRLEMNRQLQREFDQFEA